MLPNKQNYNFMCVKKGEFSGECNRTACNNKNARFFNHSTTKYYCTPCAQQINTVNMSDAQRLFGHNLCTLVEVLPETPVTNE